MKKVSMVLLFALVTMVSYSQITIGGTAGLQTNLFGGNNINTGNYGSFIDFGKWGLQYQNSGTVNLDDKQINSFINGRTTTYNAGGSVSNYGFFFNDNQDPLNKYLNFYAGGGVQHTKNVVIDYKDNLLPKIKDGFVPYANMGLKYKFNESMIGRGELLLSSVSSINVGIGFVFR